MLSLQADTESTLFLQDHNAAESSTGCLSYIVIPVALGTAIIEALLTRPHSTA